MSGNPTKREDILYRQLDEESILFDPQTNTVHVLNGTAVSIWNLCNGENDADQIVGEILNRYQTVKEQVSTDVGNSLQKFKELNLLKVST